MKVKIKPRVVPDTQHEFVDLHPVLQKIYLARGISKKSDIDNQVNNLLSYKLLSNIEQATDLLFNHINANNKILIIGDFDGDGATSTAVAVDFFRKLSVKVNYLVPNRFEYGYGLSVELVEEAKRKFDPDLLVTVDSGIACLPGVKLAKELGIDVLVTDHHLPGTALPTADVIVNPNLKDDQFPSKNMAGVGVIFYVLLALRAKLRDENWFALNNRPEINMAQFLDLVALGTVTDVVPLDYNNRILVANGLQRISSGAARVGINALIKIAKRNYKTISANDLGYSVGPRLNAAGRLDDMSLGIECLLAEDPMRAFSMAENLDALNNERKMIEREMKAEALEKIKNLDLDNTFNQQLPLGLCLFDEKWHQGVIGIIAARIKELYHRPVIVFADDNGEFIKGSCRSVVGVHIRDILQSVATAKPGLIIKFGGHAMAAGLSIRKTDFEEFNSLFNSELAKVFSHDEIFGRFDTDGELEATNLELNFAHVIKSSGPWGQHFPEPTFSGEFIVMEKRELASAHLSLRLRPAIDSYKGPQFDGIIFNCADSSWFNAPLFKINIVYKLDINEFNNQHKIQLMIDYLEIVD